MSNIKPSSDLFVLVKSLDKGEIKYFSEYISRLRSPDAAGFLALFRALRRQDEYDEKKLKATLKNKGFVKRFTFNKHILQQHIFNSLLANSGQADITSEIHKLIHLCELLKQKSLYSLSKKKLARARELCLQYEKHYALLECLDAEGRLLKLMPETDYENQMQRIISEKNTCLQKITTENQLAQLNDNLFKLYRKHNKAVNNPELEKLMQHPLLQNPQTADSFDAKLKFYNIHSHYYYMKGDFKKTLFYREKIVKLWEENPHQITEYPQRYRTELSNLLTASHFAEDYTKFETLLEKISEVRQGAIEENAFTFREVNYLKQLYLLNTAQYKQAALLLPEIKKGLEQYGKHIPPLRIQSFWFNNVITCLLNAQFKTGLEWNQLILSASSDKSFRNDLFTIAHLLEIILHLEMQKFDIALYKLRNTRDKLNYRNRMSEFEKTVIKHLQTLIKNTEEGNESAIRKTIHSFIANLQRIAAKEDKNKPTGSDEIMLWLKNKQAAATLIV